MELDAKHEEDSDKTTTKEKGNGIEKDFQQEQEKTKVLEVGKETLEVAMRNYATDQSNDENKISELKGSSSKKDIQEEEHNTTTASAEALARIFLNDEKKNDEEQREHQGK